MGRLKDARAALARAATEVGRAHDDVERLAAEVATFDGKTPTGTMAVMANQLADRLARAQQQLARAQVAHDRAITEMAAALKAKDPATWR